MILNFDKKWFSFLIYCDNRKINCAAHVFSVIVLEFIIFEREEANQMKSKKILGFTFLLLSINFLTQSLAQAAVLGWLPYSICASKDIDANVAGEQKKPTQEKCEASVTSENCLLLLSFKVRTRQNPSGIWMAACQGFLNTNRFIWN